MKGTFLWKNEELTPESPDDKKKKLKVRTRVVLPGQLLRLERALRRLCEPHLFVFRVLRLAA